MTEFHGLQLAVEQAERLRDERAKTVARLESHVGILRMQLTQLESYAQETEKRWIGGTHLEISGEMVRHHYQFVERLRHAMDLQASVIAASLHDVAMARKAQMEVEVRLKGLREVIERRRKQLQRLSLRREQLQNDEFAALVHARNAAIGDQYDD